MCSEKQAPKRNFLAERYRETAKRLAGPSSQRGLICGAWVHNFFYETHLLGTAVKLGLAIKQAHGNYEMII